MSISFMVTNGGPHPPEKWADVTARAIAALIVIEPTAPTQAIVDKREFEVELFKLLIGLHQEVQDNERALLRSGQQSAGIDPSASVDHVVGLAHRFARIGDHFSKPEARAFLHNVIGQHFADSVHIERSWHADRNRKS